MGGDWEDTSLIASKKKKMPKIEYTSEFSGGLSKLKIEEDFDRFEKALLAEFPKRLTGAVIITGLGKDLHPVFKARKFRCKSMNKGTRSGIRVIYTHDPYEDEIIFIDIYYKGKKGNHDEKLIKKYAIKIK